MVLVVLLTVELKVTISASFEVAVPFALVIAVAITFEA